MSLPSRPLSYGALSGRSRGGPSFSRIKLRASSQTSFSSSSSFSHHIHAATAGFGDSIRSVPGPHDVTRAVQFLESVARPLSVLMSGGTVSLVLHCLQLTRLFFHQSSASCIVLEKKLLHRLTVHLPLLPHLIPAIVCSLLSCHVLLTFVVVVLGGEVAHSRGREAGPHLHVTVSLAIE